MRAYINRACIWLDSLSTIMMSTDNHNSSPLFTYDTCRHFDEAMEDIENSRDATSSYTGIYLEDPTSGWFSAISLISLRNNPPCDVPVPMDTSDMTLLLDLNNIELLDADDQRVHSLPLPPPSIGHPFPMIVVDDASDPDLSMQLDHLQAPICREKASPRVREWY